MIEKDGVDSDEFREERETPIIVEFAFVEFVFSILQFSFWVDLWGLFSEIQFQRSKLYEHLIM